MGRGAPDALHRDCIEMCLSGLLRCVCWSCLLGHSGSHRLVCLALNVGVACWCCLHACSWFLFLLRWCGFLCVSLLRLHRLPRRNFRPDNLLRGLQGGVRIKGDGSASRGDVTRLIKLVGANGAYQAWKAAAERAATAVWRPKARLERAAGHAIWRATM